MTMAVLLKQVALLKSVPLRLYVNLLAFTDISFNTSLDWMNVRVLLEGNATFCL